MGGPADERLARLHRQAGDHCVIYFVYSSQMRPLKDREYIVHKRHGRLPPRAEHGEASDTYVFNELCDNSVVSWGLRPNVPRGMLRVTECKQTQIVWEATDAHGRPCTRARMRYREDPLVSIPNWVLKVITDRVLPRGIRALVQAAIEYEKRIDARVDLDDSPSVAA